MGQTHFKSIQPMNSTLTPKPVPSAASPPDDEDLDLGHYLDVLLANKWLIAAVTRVVLRDRRRLCVAGSGRSTKANL